MNIQSRRDKVELLRSITILETPETLVVVLKEVVMRMKDHTMWSSIPKTIHTKEFNNTVTCKMTSTACSMDRIYAIG